jgi:hypothetical protein
MIDVPIRSAVQSAAVMIVFEAVAAAVAPDTDVCAARLVLKTPSCHPTIPMTPATMTLLT